MEHTVKSWKIQQITIPQEDVEHTCLLPEELEISGERETMAEKLHVSVLC